MRVHQVPVAALLAAMFAVPSISQGAAGQQYSYTATALLPFTPGQGSGVATLINDPGMTCGARSSSVAFCYYAGRLFDLPPLPRDVYSVANGINDGGQVAGFSYAGSPDRLHPIVWNQGKASQLPIDAYSATAADINDAGHIIGSYNGPPVPPETPFAITAFLFKDGVVRDLGALSKARRTWPAAINNKGQIVGQSDVSDSPIWRSSFEHAFLYEKDAMRDLGTLGGHNSYANGVNDHGQVVGTSDVSPADGGPHHAFVYYNNVMHDLGAWPDGSSTQGKGINNRGQVVGAAETSGPPENPALHGRAFLWSPDTGYHDLNAMIDPAEGWTIVYATSINDRQEIVGFGCKNDLCGPVLLEHCGRRGADSKTSAGPAPDGTESKHRGTNNSRRHDPNGGRENGGAKLAFPL